MIAIEKILVSDEVVREQFLCDLTKCKGGCCEDGDAGAPLEKAEMKTLEANFEIIREYMTPAGVEEVERSGLFYFDREFGWVTPTINGKMCAYGFRDAAGVIKCGIEQAWNDGKLDWKKPISCHLFPLKTKSTKAYELVNYEPRQDLCRAACALGKKLKVPVYKFLKDALVRKYGQDFYDALDKVATGQHFK